MTTQHRIIYHLVNLITQCDICSPFTDKEEAEAYRDAINESVQDNIYCEVKEEHRNV